MEAVKGESFFIEYTGRYEITWPCRTDAVTIRLNLVMGQEVAACATCGVAATITRLDSSVESPQ